MGISPTRATYWNVAGRAYTTLSRRYPGFESPTDANRRFLIQCLLAVLGGLKRPLLAWRLLGAAPHRISRRFLVRLKEAVSSSRPDDRQGVARSRRQGWPQATASFARRAASLTAAGTAPRSIRTGHVRGTRPCVTRPCCNWRWA